MSRSISALFILFAAAVGAAPASGQLDAGPLVRTLVTSAGAGEIEIVVTNEGAERVSIDVDVNDWQVDADGNHTFRPAGTLDGSCGSRLDAAVRTLELEPRATRRVRVSFRGGAEETCRNIVFFRVTATPDVLHGERLIISTGVKVYVEPISRRSDPPGR
jgi:hypothetical protein